MVKITRINSTIKDYYKVMENQQVQFKNITLSNPNNTPSAILDVSLKFQCKKTPHQQKHKAKTQEGYKLVCFYLPAPFTHRLPISNKLFNNNNRVNHSYLPNVSDLPKNMGKSLTQ